MKGFSKLLKSKATALCYENYRKGLLTKGMDKTSARVILVEKYGYARNGSCLIPGSSEMALSPAIPVCVDAIE
ncbi:hypothetical protein [Desertivirga xinjiangensis]|uniref:hypothetical protein n=1 Tax=Desertivirga xinjiangensis TaxID=539206 RepID=UPI00210B684D|nr:hypothetical protein [Pedobacter xinjiangensis]